MCYNKISFDVNKYNANEALKPHRQETLSLWEATFHSSEFPTHKHENGGIITPRNGGQRLPDYIVPQARKQLYVTTFDPQKGCFVFIFESMSIVLSKPQTYMKFVVTRKFETLKFGSSAFQTRD